MIINSLRIKFREKFYAVLGLPLPENIDGDIYLILLLLFLQRLNTRICKRHTWQIRVLLNCWFLICCYCLFKSVLVVQMKQ